MLNRFRYYFFLNLLDLKLYCQFWNHFCDVCCAFSGKILHIDFGDCFEASMNREKFPEKVNLNTLLNVLVFRPFYEFVSHSKLISFLDFKWNRFLFAWPECLWRLWKSVVLKEISDAPVRMWCKFFERIKIVSWQWWK